MIKFFKKHCKKLIIASSILTACVCGLFGFTRSYAYSENQNGELVGNNLITQNNVSNITMNANFTNISGVYNYSVNGNFYFDVDFNNYQGNDQVNILLEFNDFTPAYFMNKKFSLGFLIESDNFSIGQYSTSLYAYGGLRRNGSTSDYANSVVLNESFLTGFSGSYNLCYFRPYDTANWNSYPNSHFIIFLRINNHPSNIVNGSLKFTFFMFENSTLNELSFNSNQQTFYPYSSIAELEYNYQQLQQQYNDYVANHTYSDTQYNVLVSANSSLQQQLSTLQLQYNTYVATHSHTDTEYNNLLSGYEDLLDTQRELESDYELLQEQYNELLNKYQRYQNPASYGWFTYIDYIQAYNSSYDSGEVSFDELVSDGYVSNYTFLLDDFVNDNIEADDGTLHVDIVFRENVVPLNLFEFTFTDMTYSGYLSIKNFYMNTNGSSYTYFFNHNVINVREVYYMEHGVYPNDEQLEFAKAISQYIYVNQISLDGVPLRSDVHDFTIVSNDAVDSYSFNLGFQSGYYNGTLSNNDLKTEINGLNKKINELYSNINTLRNLNTELQDQISNSYGWKSLFFAMADTPFKTVSNVLGFELFGLNLFTTFIGIITVFAIIWILKKFI